MAQHHHSRSRLFFIAGEAASEQRLRAKNGEEIARHGYPGNMQGLVQARQREAVLMVGSHCGERFGRGAPIQEIGVRGGKVFGDSLLLKSRRHKYQLVRVRKRQRL